MITDEAWGNPRGEEHERKNEARDERKGSKGPKEKATAQQAWNCIGRRHLLKKKSATDRASEVQ